MKPLTRFVWVTRDVREFCDACARAYCRANTEPASPVALKYDYRTTHDIFSRMNEHHLDRL